MWHRKNHIKKPLVPWKQYLSPIYIHTISFIHLPKIHNGIVIVWKKSRRNSVNSTVTSQRLQIYRVPKPSPNHIYSEWVNYLLTVLINTFSVLSLYQSIQSIQQNSIYRANKRGNFFNKIAHTDKFIYTLDFGFLTLHHATETVASCLKLQLYR